MNRAASVKQISYDLEEARCPRCGYDLRGAVSAWTVQCPLEGTCTECGLCYEWRYVLLIAKWEPKWCVEFAEGGRQLLTAWVITPMRSLWPFGFWRRLNMASRVRWRRLRAYMFAPLALLATIYLAVQLGHAWQLWTRANIWVQRAPAQMVWETQMLEQQLATTRNLDPGYEQHLRLRIEQLNASMQNKGRIDHTFGAAALEMIVTPFAERSTGVVYSPDLSRHVYPAPIEIAQYLSTPFGTPGVVPWSPANADPIKNAAMNLGVGFAVVLLLPLSFVLLPVSRRRARVQWRHIGRIAAYSVIFPAAIGIVLLAFVSVRSFCFTTPWIPHILWDLPIVLWVMLPIWWWAAIKHYLRMPHALAIAALMSLMIALLFSPILFADMPLWMERLLL